MDKYVFIDENMNVKSFTRFVNEAEDETERKRELKRTSVEDMLKPYGEFSDTARRVLEVAVKRGVITNRQRPAVYPCYRAQAGSNSYIFYDAETGRIMEIVKPVDKSAWHIRFGDKFADDKPNTESSDEARRTTIATLKSNFESMYSMC